MADQICILVCTPRSGHSWLTRLLGQHPQLKVFSHDGFHNHVLYLLYPLKSTNPWAEDGTDLSSPLERLLLARRVDLLRRYYRDDEATRTVVLSTSTAVACLPLLLAAFPAARVVHLTRDPFDVIASFRRFMLERESWTLRGDYRDHRHLGRPLALRYAFAHAAHTWRWRRCPHPGYLVVRPVGFQEARSLPIVDFLAWYYRQSEAQITDALAGIPPRRQHTVSYEALVNDYDTEMKALLVFIGVDPGDDFVATTAATVTGTSIGRGRRDLDDDERARLSGLLGQSAPGPARPLVAPAPSATSEP